MKYKSEQKGLKNQPFVGAIIIIITTKTELHKLQKHAHYKVMFFLLMVSCLYSVQRAVGAQLLC